MASRQEIEILRELFDKIAALIGVQDISFERVEPPDDTLDFAARLSIGGKELHVVGVVETVGEPWAVRSTVHRLREYHQSRPEHAPLLVAPFIGPGGRELCKENGVGYIDLSGNCYLEGNGIYIDKVAGGNRSREPKRAKALFSDKGSLVVRAVLERVSQPHGVRELSRQLGVSPAWTSQVLSAMVKAGYAARANRETHVSRPSELLRDWAESYDFLRRNDVYPFFCDSPTPQALIARIASLNGAGQMRYALTLHAAASLVAPFAEFHEVHVYVDPSVGRSDTERLWMEALDLEKVDRGGNIYLVRPYYKESVFYGVRQINNVSVVSDVQLYLDLYNFPMRGREQADHLMRERLSYLTNPGSQQ